MTEAVRTKEELARAIVEQNKAPVVRIGQVLVSMGLLAADQLALALQEQQGAPRRERLGAILVRNGFIQESQLRTGLLWQMRYPLVDLISYDYEEEAVGKISMELAKLYRVLPLGQMSLPSGIALVVAKEPAARMVVDDQLVQQVGMTIIAVVGMTGDIDVDIERVYDQLGLRGHQKSIAALAAADVTGLMMATGADSEADDGDADVEFSDNKLVQYINGVIMEALRRRVSDIHIETNPGRGEAVLIRFRKDGELSDYQELPASYRSAVIARLKVMCELDLSEKRRPQDGKITFSKFVPGVKLELRVATMPTVGGAEDAVLRLLSSAKAIPLTELGLSDRNFEVLARSIERPYGMILCVGPTGSGKTTTLHSGLHRINRPNTKIWTAEDPVEITQKGLRQVQVNAKIEFNFPEALRSFLRCDPDVIMVGEIRDHETASMAIEASLTGHLVLSTLHTNSAPETVTRLLDMGMDPFNFADSMLAIIAQRLVRKFCRYCKVSHEASEEELAELAADYVGAFAEAERPDRLREVRAGWLTTFANDGKISLYSAPGCSSCSGSGFEGRAGLHEVLEISRELRHLIQTRSPVQMIQDEGIRGGMRTLRQDGIDKVLAGVTNIAEIRKVTNA